MLQSPKKDTIDGTTGKWDEDMLALKDCEYGDHKNQSQELSLALLPMKL
jgi:hypothetical protein